MKRKVIIRESQLRMIVEHVSGAQPLKEGAGQVSMSILLGVAALMGVKLTNFNDKVAKEALSTPKTLNQIKKYLESDRVDDVAAGLEGLGMANASDRIEKEAYEIQKKFNDIAFNTEGVTGGLAINLDN